MPVVSSRNIPYFQGCFNFYERNRSVSYNCFKITSRGVIMKLL